MIALEAIGYSYPGRANPVLNGLSLRLEPGRLTCLLGPNGSGKSTLLSLASGLLRPQSGRVVLDGRDAAEMDHKARARAVAVLPQRAADPPAYRVRDYVLLGRYAHTPFSGTFATADREAASEAIRLCGADALADRTVTQLSGGEFQRVLLARAIAQSRRCLLLDELSTGLDPQFAIRLFSLLARLVKAEGSTVLAAVHDINLAARFAHRLVILSGGRILADGTPDEVLTPATLEAAYGIRFSVFPHPLTGHPQALPAVPEEA